MVNVLFDFFRNIQKTTWIVILFTFLVVVGSFVYRANLNTFSPQLGVFGGQFCISEDSTNEPLVLKSFHIFPLFVSRCSYDGRLEVDSDLDGLCDSEEIKRGSNPRKRFSIHSEISDGIWWKLKKEQKQRIRSLDFCDTGDQDADLLTNCEEQVLTSDYYEAFNSDRTQDLYEMGSLNINHPDTDGDGYIDGIEVRFLNEQAPFVFSNDEINIDQSEKILKFLQETPQTPPVETSVQPLDSAEFCYKYELKNLQLWLPAVRGFDLLVQNNKGPIKLDFLIYALTSKESDPDEALSYGARVISIEFFKNKFSESRLDETLTLSKIGGPSK